MNNPNDLFLQDAGLPEAAPQYKSFGFSDELGWAAAWLYDATREMRYLDEFKSGMQRGEDRWWYEGFAASWDDLNPMAKLKMVSVAPPTYKHTTHLLESLRDYVNKWHACSDKDGKLVPDGLRLMLCTEMGAACATRAHPRS